MLTSVLIRKCQSTKLDGLSGTINGSVRIYIGIEGSLCGILIETQPVPIAHAQRIGTSCVRLVGAHIQVLDLALDEDFAITSGRSFAQRVIDLLASTDVALQPFHLGTFHGMSRQVVEHHDLTTTIRQVEYHGTQVAMVELQLLNRLACLCLHHVLRRVRQGLQGQQGIFRFIRQWVSQPHRPAFHYLTGEAVSHSQTHLRHRTMVNP